ncbi:acyltransferase domain-containing protein [Actinomadura welshii]
MNGKDVVLLLPGQGAYLPDAMPRLAARHPEVAAVVGEVDAACVSDGMKPVSDVLLAEAPPTLDALMTDDPEMLQLALYASNLAMHRLLTRAGVRPALLVGHSLGEISALVAAGAFDVADGTRIMIERNRALRGVREPGGMTALGASAERAAALVALVDDPGLVVAVENAPRQTVLSGPVAALEKAEALAGALGITATRFRAPFAFHNPALAAAASGFTAAVRGLQRPIRTPVFSPILGRAYSDADDLAALLGSHLTVPVRFLDALRSLHARGADVYVECGARAALTGLVRATLPDVTALACADGLQDPQRSFAQVVQRLSEKTALEVTEDAGAEPSAPVRSEPAEPPVTHAVPDAGPPEPDTAPAPAGNLDRDAVVLALREFYALTLEYPVDVVEEDAELEADLGVDSLKQTELLRQVAERYGIDGAEEGFRIGDAATLGRLADLIVRTAPAAAA